MSTPRTRCCRCEDLHAHYGKSHILHGVELRRSARGEVVSLLGRNGSGRSTTLKAIMGLVPPTAGRVRLARPRAGRRQAARHLPRRPRPTCPRSARSSPTSPSTRTCAWASSRRWPARMRWTIEQMFDYFPRLKERRNTKAGSLSGGEQQMLTICRSLLGNPLVILIDEPTEGLAPKIVAQVGECIEDMHRRGVSVVLVEQKLAIALKVSSRVCVMGHGRIVFEGTPAAARRRPGRCCPSGWPSDHPQAAKRHGHMPRTKSSSPAPSPARCTRRRCRHTCR